MIDPFDLSDPYDYPAAMKRDADTIAALEKRIAELEAWSKLWADTAEQASKLLTAERQRIAELEAFVKCPIGLDDHSDICSAGSCRICLSKLRQDFDAERKRLEECEAVLREVANAPNRIAENARIIADYFGEGKP